MKLSKEQLLKLVKAQEYNFNLEPLNGAEDDVFQRVDDIRVSAVLDYYDDKCDVDLQCNFKAYLYDVNTNKIHVEEFYFETYFVVSEQYFEADYFVYMFEKNTLNLDTIIKEEIYYRLPQDYSKVESNLMDEDEFYYREYQKLITKSKEETDNLELLKLKKLFDN